MAQNRTVPYGYKIENGKLVIEPQEEHIVVRIYERYANGESYLKIAEQLTALGVRYTPDKVGWNKNMVARVLQNKNYLGNDKYPTIIYDSLHQSAEKQTKPYTHRMNKEIKILKPYLVCSECGKQLQRRLKATGEERWYCPNDTDHISIKVNDESLINDILELQKKLISKGKNVGAKDMKSLNAELIILKNQIDLAMKEPTPNLNQIKESIMALAGEKYNIIDSVGEDSYTSHVIEKISTTEIDSVVLEKIVSKIKITHTKATELILQNGQKIKI